MSKLVIVAKSLETGQRAVFVDLEEAARAIGVSAPAVSLACSEGRSCSGWQVRRVERVFAVQTSIRRDWVVANAHPRNEGVYLELGNPARVIGKKEVGQVKDITVAWYL